MVVISKKAGMLPLDSASRAAADTSFYFELYVAYERRTDNTIVREIIVPLAVIAWTGLITPARFEHRCSDYGKRMVREYYIPRQGTESGCEHRYLVLGTCMLPMCINYMSKTEAHARFLKLRAMFRKWQKHAGPQDGVRNKSCIQCFNS